MTNAKLIDFCLSLTLANEKIETKKEYKLIQKMLPEDFLAAILQYQNRISEHQQKLLPFVNTEYNLLLYFTLLNDVQTFDDLIVALNHWSKEDCFQLVSTYIIESEQKFTIKALIDVQLTSENKWQLTELFTDFANKKEKLLQCIPTIQQMYQETAQLLESQYSEKINEETQLLQAKSDQLYEIVFKDYVASEDFHHSEQNLIFLLNCYSVFYFNDSKTSYLGCGVFAREYFEFIRGTAAYSQTFRENILKILADPTRFGILKMINSGISSNKVIARKFGISPAAVSYQIKNLLENQLILVENSHKKYRLNNPLLKQLLNGIENELFL